MILTVRVSLRAALTPNLLLGRGSWPGSPHRPADVSGHAESGHPGLPGHQTRTKLFMTCLSKGVL